MLITRYKPNTSREHAARMLSGRLNRVTAGKLRGVIDIYIPYRLFNVAVANGRETAESILAIDSVNGGLDLYRFDRMPSDEISSVESANVVLPAMSEAGLAELLADKVRRAAYLRGFFRIKSLSVSVQPVLDLHLPYWVGVYRRQDRVTLEVIDAVRNRLEGGKVRDIVAQWFQSGSLVCPSES